MRTYSTTKRYRLAVSGCLLVVLSFVSWLSITTASALNHQTIAPVVAPAPHPVPLAVIGQTSEVRPAHVSPGTPAEVMPGPHPVPWPLEARVPSESVHSGRWHAPSHPDQCWFYPLFRALRPRLANTDAIAAVARTMYKLDHHRAVRALAAHFSHGIPQR